MGPSFLNSCFRILFANLCFSVLMAKMVAPQRATKCREINSNKRNENQIACYFNEHLIECSPKVQDRIWVGGEVGINQSLHLDLTSPLNGNQVTQLCHFSHCPSAFVFSFCCFWSGTIEMSYNKRRKLDIKSAILNTSM